LTIKEQLAEDKIEINNILREFTSASDAYRTALLYLRLLKVNEKLQTIIDGVKEEVVVTKKTSK